MRSAIFASAFMIAGSIDSDFVFKFERNAVIVFWILFFLDIAFRENQK